MHSIAKHLIFCFLITLCTLSLKAQTAASIPLFYEKVYLHTDRDVYTQGEDIWFKAYLVNARDNKPLNNSHNLYVELISPDFKIALRNVIRLENGLGNGDFKLPDTLAPGTYRIRAYTNWMRNFGDNFIFEKNITIVNTLGKLPAIALTARKPGRKVKNKPVVVIKKDTLPPGPLVQFFPEGGAMINNINAVVAVKAEDGQGRGTAASGVILASSGRLVAKFVCDSLGFGFFTLNPDQTQSYQAIVTIKQARLTFKLPYALSNGFTLGANSVSPFIMAEINCNISALSEAGGANLIIMGRHGGKIIYTESLRLQSQNMLVQMPDANFPEGIACITLYDTHKKPLSERLVYVHHAVNTNLKVFTDSVVYKPKQKVTVKIKLSDTSLTHLSMAAVDEGLVPVPAENILSYLELRSEVRGTIEHPERYFDTTNVNRFKQMDLLLLTQGWRDFIWKGIDDSKFNKQYDLEQAITVTGSVRRVLYDKTVKNVNITMFSPKANGDKLFTSKTDSTGRFTIYGPVLFGNNYGRFTASNNDGSKRGWIRVDSLWKDTLAINVTHVPDTATDKRIKKVFTDRDIQKKRFDFNAINKLRQVNINSDTIHKIPPTAIHFIKAKDYGNAKTYLLFDYLVDNIPGASATSDDFGNPIIDFHHFDVGINVSYADHSKIIKPKQKPAFLLMNQVLKVTIHYKYIEAGRYTGPVSDVRAYADVVLRPNALDKFDLSYIWADLKGYDEPRIFYSPQRNIPDTQPDLRTTIHWEPNITTDKNGEATLTYYNADPKTKIRLIVQGVTDSGVPVVASTGYVVK